MFDNLTSLHIPDSISLRHKLLRNLPATLETAALSVAFDDACMDGPDGQAYIFPPSMPHLRHLHLQVCCTAALHSSFRLVCSCVEV